MYNCGFESMTLLYFNLTITVKSPLLLDPACVADITGLKIINPIKIPEIKNVLIDFNSIFLLIYLIKKNALLGLLLDLPINVVNEFTIDRNFTIA